MSESCEVIVVGAGAAGLLAATRAAECGRHVVLVEKNRKPGVKILMSGGTRCNLTQATDVRGIVDAFGKQGPFLHSALAAFGPNDLVELVEAEGVATKTEHTGKIFPESDRAADVLDALVRRLGRSGAQLTLEEPVVSIQREGDGFMVETSRAKWSAERLIVTTGGQSYAGCGTTGEGYAWAKRFGHKIIPPRPALVPLTTDAKWVVELRGLTVPDVAVRLEQEDRTLAARRGSFLFTHWGLSGPVVLDVSREVTAQGKPNAVRLVCDFLPDESAETLAGRLQSEAAAAGKRPIGAILGGWLPRRLAEALLIQAEVPPDRRVAELSRAERSAVVQHLTATSIPIAGTLGFKKAEVTAGGISLDEVDSRTMQSKLAANLYLAGEVLDLDGPIGGYNFQAAFSTGWLAGQSAAT
jgi:predicted Rossmann fold flavoprotein